MPITTLTYSILQNRLFAANSAISYLSNQIISMEDSGYRVKRQKANLQKLMDYVDALWEYTSAIQPTASSWVIDMSQLNSAITNFTARTIYNTSTIFNATITWQGSVASTVSAMAALIKSQTTWGVKYNGSAVIVTAPAIGTAYNSAVGYTSTLTSMGVTNTTANYTGGASNSNAPFDDTYTALKVNEIESILDAMCSLIEGVPVQQLLTWS